MSETLYLVGAGTIVLFDCSTRHIENKPWRHHLRLVKGALIVDGCVWASWPVDETCAFIYEHEATE